MKPKYILKLKTDIQIQYAISEQERSKGDDNYEKIKQKWFYTG